MGQGEMKGHLVWVLGRAHTLVQVPCGQDKHAEMLEDPSIGLYVFAAHALQADAPKKSLNSPAKQGVQAVTFVEELKVPGWQGTQGDPTKNPDCTT